MKTYETPDSRTGGIINKIEKSWVRLKTLNLKVYECIISINYRRRN